MTAIFRAARFALRRYLLPLLLVAHPGWFGRVEGALPLSGIPGPVTPRPLSRFSLALPGAPPVLVAPPAELLEEVALALRAPPLVVSGAGHPAQTRAVVTRIKVVRVRRISIHLCCGLIHMSITFGGDYTLFRRPAVDFI